MNKSETGKQIEQTLSSSKLGVDPHVFVPQTAYRPSSEYFDCASALLPKMWRLMQTSFWTQFIAPNKKPAVQGWKIHVSATPDSAKRILEKVAPVCIGLAIEFKFASDENILRQLLAKGCSRQSSGKFITIYPPTVALSKQVLEELYPLLCDEIGPYILSDRRYKDSSVLHYRYGGFKSFPEVDVRGNTTMCILDDRYQFIEDIRAPQFSLPSFMQDIFDESPRKSMDQVHLESGSEAPKSAAVFGGKYTISSVIKFTNSGGVYHGKNILNDEAVIIKESRPFTGIDRIGTDNIARLEKEHRIMNTIAHDGIAPKSYDLFREWEHVFLALEIAKGVTVRQFVVSSSPLIHNTASADAMHKWMEDILTVSIRLLEMVGKLHRHNIIFGDLSLNNVIIDVETLTLKLIDFEGAYEPGVDPLTNMFTPGYGRFSRTKRDSIDFDDDYYALGNMLLAMLAPNPTVNQINEKFATQFVDAVSEEIELPEQFKACMVHLLERSDANLDECIDLLKSAQIVHAETSMVARSLNVFKLDPDMDFCSVALHEIFAYNQKVMDTSQAERVFPVGPLLSDVMAVDHGMLGIAYAWQKVKGEIPADFTSWIQKHFRTNDARPGLVNGISGTAWVLSELGHPVQAAAAMRRAKLNPLLFQKMSLGYGASGYGLANLYFWNKTGEAHYLQEAIKIADILCETAIEHPNGLVWEDPTDKSGTAVGWLEGSSGIALFLLYAFCASGDSRYLQVGERGLEFDVACGREAGVSFGFPRRSGSADHILLPYVDYGTAGVSSVVLRYYAVTGKPIYRAFAEKVKGSVAQKFTVVPGLYDGLAGLGNYLLDAYDFLKDESYLGLAHRVAQGIKLFRIEREGGCVFPGLDQAKLTCDYANGSAGIALFLHRLITGGGNFNFTLDDLIDAGKTAMQQHARDNKMVSLAAKREASLS